MILILTGPPGVGKTTTAAILAARMDRSVHLEADTFFGFIRNGYVEPWKPESREQNDVVMRLVAEAAIGYADAGYFTILEGIVLPSWYLVPTRDAIRDAGHEVAYAVMRAPLATCVERARTRERFPFGDGEVIERLWQGYTDLGELEQNAIDVDDRPPEQAAEILAERLADGGLSV